MEREDVIAGGLGRADRDHAICLYGRWAQKEETGQNKSGHMRYPDMPDGHRGKVQADFR
jgi:hypothetical protein